MGRGGSPRWESAGGTGDSANGGHHFRPFGDGQKPLDSGVWPECSAITIGGAIIRMRETNPDEGALERERDERRPSGEAALAS